MVYTLVERLPTQLGALSTLVILIMSSIGGSMFPRFLMSEAMQKAGLFTINAWAIDGSAKMSFGGSCDDNSSQCHQR